MWFYFNLVLILFFKHLIAYYIPSIVLSGKGIPEQRSVSKLSARDDFHLCGPYCLYWAPNSTLSQDVK